MQPTLCSKCKKYVAVVYVSRMEDGKPVNEGLCLRCAKALGLPQVDDMMKRMGISDDELEKISEEMVQAFGGAENLDQFPANINDLGGDGEENDGDETDEGKTATFPFLNRLFNADNQRSDNGPEGAAEETKAHAPKKNGKRKFLENYCINLTGRARAGELDAVIGRETEIERVIQILNRRQKNNPCLIGEPGVGKTAIAEGIAQKLASGDVPPRLADKELYILDLTALVAGTQFRGQFESRVKGLIEDVKNKGNVILFIDEIHNLVGAGDSEGSMNAANIFKPALSRGQLQVIGATTFNEYRKNIEKDAALERRFQPIIVDEPSIEDAVEVLAGIKEYYEQYHRVTVSEEIVRMAVVLSERYVNDRYLPDKAIDLLDEACSCATLRNEKLAEYDRNNRRMNELKEQEEALESQNVIDYEQLAGVKAEMSRLKERQLALEPEAIGMPVTADDLAKVVELWTKIPASKIREGELKKVAHIEETLKSKIIGQNEAVELVSAAVRRSRIQISGRRRPASFIFVGPTGVGKTELVKVLSQALFDSVDPLIRLDMSEYMEKHTVSRLVGSPPGYVGYDEAGQLTEKVRRRPYSVVLFDEIEKAHPDVLNILLQILDEGHITDAHGRNVSFENTVIVMTSNAGSQIRENTLGFNRQADEAAKDRAIKGLREFLRPEFLARVDEIVFFRSLDEQDFAKIARLMMEELREPLRERAIELCYDDAVLAAVAHKAYSTHQNGAREIRRVIRKEVEDPICLLLVEKSEEPVSKAVVSAAGDGQLAVRVE